MQVIFFGAAVVLQNLLTLGSLEFGMIILVFLLMTFSPILIDVITAWLRNIYSRSLDSGEQGKFAAFIDKLRNLAVVLRHAVDRVGKRNDRDIVLAQQRERQIGRGARVSSIWNSKIFR